MVRTFLAALLLFSCCTLSAKYDDDEGDSTVSLQTPIEQLYNQILGSRLQGHDLNTTGMTTGSEVVLIPGYYTTAVPLGLLKDQIDSGDPATYWQINSGTFSVDLFLKATVLDTSFITWYPFTPYGGPGMGMRLTYSYNNATGSPVSVPIEYIGSLLVMDLTTGLVVADLNTAPTTFEVPAGENYGFTLQTR